MDIRILVVDRMIANLSHHNTYGYCKASYCSIGLPLSLWLLPNVPAAVYCEILTNHSVFS